MCCSESDSLFHMEWNTALFGGRHTKENSGDSKINPLNIAISKAAESGSTKVLLMRSLCVPACPDIYLEMQTRVLSMPFMATRNFQPNLSRDLVMATKAQNWYNIMKSLSTIGKDIIRETDTGGLWGGLHGSAIARRALSYQITSLYCASVSISALRQATRKTSCSMFWDSQVMLQHSVAESIWNYQFPASHYLQTGFTKSANR